MCTNTVLYFQGAKLFAGSSVVNDLFLQFLFLRFHFLLSYARKLPKNSPSKIFKFGSKSANNVKIKHLKKKYDMYMCIYLACNSLNFRIRNVNKIMALTPTNA